MSRTFHLLTESDCFSRHSHEDLARWVANVIQADADTTVLAPCSEGSWPSMPTVRVVNALRTYRTLCHAVGHVLPHQFFAPYLRHILTNALQDLKPGDTVWIHNRPEFVLALAPFIKKTGARLFLHLHRRQLLSEYAGLLRISKADCCVFNSQLAEQEALQNFPNLGQTAVMSSGLDTREFHPSAKHAVLSRSPGHAVEQANVVFSAYLARENDVQVFLDAMAILESRQVPVSGTIIGGPRQSDRDSNPAQFNRRKSVRSLLSLDGLAAFCSSKKCPSASVSGDPA